VAKFDYKKDLRHLYLPGAKGFTIVDVPPLQFVMIDGQGDPNKAPAFQEATSALYTMAYTLKFGLKPQGIEFAVAPLEGLWWVPDMAEFDAQAKDRWYWTLMIMQPDAVTADIFERLRGEAMRKKNLPMLPQVRLETYHEGLSVQIMYFGSYADEGPTIARMHEFIAAEGYLVNGKHHEIYVGNPQRTPPEKLRTVIRQPIRKA